MVHNPFYHRGPVRDSTHFCNRLRETEQIANLVPTSQSVSIVGPRRTGRTSLFYRLLGQDVRVAHGLAPPDHAFVSIEAQGMEQAPLLEIYALLINGVQEALCASEADWH